ncbi:MAG: helix-turn-helix domain-containing protein [Burkholderiales bacterium]
MTPADLKSARLRLGMTQAQVAFLLRVDRVTWTRWESGARPMSPMAWAYFKHVAGLERLPWRAFRAAPQPGSK